MRISARNQIKGTVIAVTEGAVMAEVTIRIGSGEEIVSAITIASVRTLGIAVGKEVVAIIKSTEVMIGIDD